MLYFEFKERHNHNIVLKIVNIFYCHEVPFHINDE
jgi:hypothetical protein